MISLDNIHSFTQFQRNAKAFADQVRGTKKPLILTVNGEAALVVHEAGAFQELLDRVTTLENELNALKLETLRQDIQVGIDQADRGEFSTRSIDDIKAEGRRRLAERQQH
jgi:PHD/YefM family antitoxin component YafN of YafNO toxin-antitoxin module